MKAEEAIATVAKISIIAVADCTVATRLHGGAGKKSNVAGAKTEADSNCRGWSSQVLNTKL